MWPIFRALRQTLASRPAHEAAPAVAEGWAAPLLQLGLTLDELHALLRTGTLEPHFTYSRYRKPKSSGGWREIAEPDPRLKYLQTRLVRQRLTTAPAHPAAVAYQAGRSTLNHVEPHLGAAVIVTADVKDFFPSTRAGRIELWWRERVEREAAEVLTLLTTDRGGLPQGAPSSPVLSNAVNFELDQKLFARATTAGARYTRYCDDLAFSWPHGDGPRADFERAVRGALHEFGYALHPDKGWRVHELRDEPEITGLVLTRSGGVRLPERIREVMRVLARSSDPHDAERLEGYRGYARLVTGRKPRRR